MADLNEILIFTRVVECGSITAAAKRLEMQKSTVSRKLATMEARLGVRLLSRTTRSLSLTDIGKSHYSRCREIISAWEESEQALRETRDEPSGNMRLLMPVDLGQRLMISIINEFLTQHPQVSIDAELSTRESRLVEEGLDLVIRIGQPEDSSLIARKLFSVERKLYASEALIKRYGLPRHPNELKDYPCICLGTPQVNPSWLLCKKNTTFKHKPSGPFKINNLSCCLDAAIAGIGIACLPHVLCHEHVARGDIIQLLPDWQADDAEVYALYPHREFTPFIVRHFIDFTQKKNTNSQQSSQWLQQHRLILNSLESTCCVQPMSKAL